MVRRHLIVIIFLSNPTFIIAGYLNDRDTNYHFTIFHQVFMKIFLSSIKNNLIEIIYNYWIRKTRRSILRNEVYATYEQIVIHINFIKFREFSYIYPTVFILKIEVDINYWYVTYVKFFINYCFGMVRWMSNFQISNYSTITIYIFCVS